MNRSWHCFVAVEQSRKLQCDRNHVELWLAPAISDAFCEIDATTQTDLEPYSVPMGSVPGAPLFVEDDVEALSSHEVEDDFECDSSGSVVSHNNVANILLEVSPSNFGVVPVSFFVDFEV
jgi:hypothetical protein